MDHEIRITPRELLDYTAKDGWRVKECSLTVDSISIADYLSLDLGPVREKMYRDAKAECDRRNALEEKPQ